MQVLNLDGRAGLGVDVIIVNQGIYVQFHVLLLPDGFIPGKRAARLLEHPPLVHHIADRIPVLVQKGLRLPRVLIKGLRALLLFMLRLGLKVGNQNFRLLALVLLRAPIRILFVLAPTQIAAAKPAG